jgi:hypothetical protein
MHGRKALAGIIVVAAVITATLISAVAVQAKTQHYEGSVADAKGEIAFDLKRQGGDLKIRDLHGWVAWTCSDPGAPASKSFEIRKIKWIAKRRFKARWHTGSAHEGYELVEVYGRLQSGGRASGTVHAQSGIGVFTFCDSTPGVPPYILEWTAST